MEQTYWREIKKSHLTAKRGQDIPRLLILNAGSRNHLIKCFLKSWGDEGEIMVSDSYPLAPVLYENCRSFLIPSVTSPNYKKAILNLCLEEKVSGILSLLDPDLSLLAEMKDELLANGIKPFISQEEIVKATFDKWSMYQLLKTEQIPTIKSWISEQEFLAELQAGTAKFPLMVKPRQGSGSRGLHYVTSRQDLHSVLENADEPMLIQAWIEGRELGADLYFDFFSGNLVEYFIKQKLKMRAGETDKSVSFYDEKAEKLLFKLAAAYAFCGTIDVDLFITEDNEYLVSEINPRFGGGYPHAYACGADFPRWILKNLQNEQLTYHDRNWQPGHYMMKYFDMIFLNSEEMENVGSEIQ